jgi:nucleotide-binding universal stress UspA family protein
MTGMRVVIWVVEGTWQGCVDAALEQFPSGAQFTLLHVTPSDVTEAADAATIGLFGRRATGRRALSGYGGVADDEAAKLLAAAADRLGNPEAEQVSRSGRVEREVVNAVANGVDVLVVARDGDHTRLGPRSLGHATRFVVDHAPCAVLLVWPDESPGIDSIPDPRHGPPPPPPPPR